MGGTWVPVSLHGRLPLKHLIELCMLRVNLKCVKALGFQCLCVTAASILLTNTEFHDWSLESQITKQG